MNLSNLLQEKLPPVFYQRILLLSKYCRKFSLKAYLVGGVVRDLLLSSSIHSDIQPESARAGEFCVNQRSARDFSSRNELDITVEGGNLTPLARQLSKKWKASLTAYPQFLTFTLEFPDGSSMDLITARKEKYPFPASLPVVQRGSLKTDLARRDFSIHAMAVSLSASDWGKLVDFHHGLLDLKKKEIKILHSKSFEDDPTRIFRAARFAGRFSFRLEKKSSLLLRESVEKKVLQKLSADRIRNELEKILLEKKPSSALTLLSKWGVLIQIHPHLKWNFGKHFCRVFDSMTHQMADCEILKIVRMALWLHSLPEKMSREILPQLNFTKSFQEKVLDLVSLSSSLTGKDAVSSIPDRNLDVYHFLFLEALQKIKKDPALQEKQQEYQRWIKCAPQIDGSDLKKLGFKPGPIYRKILRSLRLAKFRGKVKTKQEEIKFVKKFVKGPCQAI